jgi:hypothetical protein
MSLLRSPIRSSASAFARIILAACFGTASLHALPAVAEEQPTDAAALPQAPASPSPDETQIVDDEWHFGFSPYLWFPGMHGAVGALGRSVGVHASATDLLSNFRFGLMGTVEARRKHILIPVDMDWVRLGDDKAIPFPGTFATSADFKGSEFILTPKVGYRVVDRERIKADALAGFRYWHWGQSIEFSPSQLGLQFSGAQNWVDPIVGGRLEAPLMQKTRVTIFGDVGGWGTGSQLEYQVGGLLGYDLKKAWRMQAGYRYMDVDYTSGGTLIDVAMSGIVVGVTYHPN